MRRLLHLLADGDLYPVTLINRLNSWSGDPPPNKDNIPLRLAAGLHALVLSGQDPALKACVTPPQQSVPLVNLRMAVQAALRNHAAHILRWLNYIPQTNEIGRSAVLIATALILERRFNLPLIVSELG